MTHAAMQPDLSDVEKASIAEAIKDRLTGYSDAACRLDLAWFREFWADDGDFVIAGDGALLDHSSWDRQLESDLAGIREMSEFAFSNGRTHVLSRDAAVHTTQFRWALVDTAGTTVRMHGSWCYVFKRIHGTWQVIHSAGTHLPE